jgi:hypothetical protein
VPAVKKAASLSNNLTQAIERRIIESGAEGLTHEAIMRTFAVGRTCARNHIRVLEEAGRIHHTKHTKTINRWKPPKVFYTFHAGSGKPLVDLSLVRRDWLVEAFFGPARKEAA